MHRQRGYLKFPSEGEMALMLVVVAVFGWCVIEGAIWLFSRISISWGG